MWHIVPIRETTLKFIGIIKTVENSYYTTSGHNF